jgi:hypothetical protein
MQNRDGQDILVAPHAQMSVFLPIKETIPFKALVRRIKE